MIWPFRRERRARPGAPVPNMSDGMIVKLPPAFGDKLIETRPTFDAAMVDAHQTITRLICTEHGIPVQLALPTIEWKGT